MLWLSCEGQIDVWELCSDNSYLSAILDRQGLLVAATVDIRTKKTENFSPMQPKAELPRCPALQKQGSMLNGGSHARLRGWFSAFCREQQETGVRLPLDEWALGATVLAHSVAAENVHRADLAWQSQPCVRSEPWVRFDMAVRHFPVRLNVINDARAVASTTSRSIHHVPAMTARAGAKGPCGASASPV